MSQSQQCFGLGAELGMSWDVSQGWLGSSRAVTGVGKGSATGLGGCWKIQGQFHADQSCTSKLLPLCIGSLKLSAFDSRTC